MSVPVLNRREYAFNIVQKIKNTILKVESFLFDDDADYEHLHNHIFQNYFDENYTIRSKFMEYIRREMLIGLASNYLLSFVLVVYLPLKFWECWSCDPVMTTWITLLGIMNILLLIPKHFILRRIRKILSMTDSYSSSYLTWVFFRSKIYKFNNQCSKIVFIIYTIGSLLIWWSKLSNCMLFFTVSSLILVTFITRLYITISTFNKNFANQQYEMLLEYYNGVTTERITTLKGTTFEEHKKINKGIEHLCSICYEQYTVDNKVKVMECPGEHVFHLKCIDRWLLKSDKCPLCNYSVYYNRKEKWLNKWENVYQIIYWLIEWYAKFRLCVCGYGL